MTRRNTPPIPPKADLRTLAIELVEAISDHLTDNRALWRLASDVRAAAERPERTRPGLLPDVDHALGAIAAMKAGKPIAPEDIRAIVALAETGADELAGFDIRWNADMRAIAAWREAHPGNDLVLPDHADLVVWLMDVFDCSFDRPTVAQVENVRARLGAAQLRAPNQLTKDARDIVDQLADALRKTSRRAFMAEERARAAEAVNVQWDGDEVALTRDLLNDAMNELIRLHDDSGIGEPPTAIAKIKSFLDFADADRASLDRVEARLDAEVLATAPAEPLGGKNTADYDRRQMEERINAVLARQSATGPVDAGEIGDVVDRIAPGWEWVEASSMGGPTQITLARFAPGEPL